MIDEKINVWLIEINTNPCIEESSPLLKMYLYRMIDDSLKLTIDKIFSTGYEIYQYPNVNFQHQTFYIIVKTFPLFSSLF